MKSLSAFALLASLSFAAQACTAETETTDEHAEQRQDTDDDDTKAKENVEVKIEAQGDLKPLLHTGRRQHQPLSLTME